MTPSSVPPAGAPSPPSLSPLLKLVLELGPLGVFFLANSRPGLFEPLLRPFLADSLFADGRGAIFVATAVFMAAMIASLAVTWWLVRRLPVMPVVSGVVVIVFGALTLALHDELFIKLKPTIVNGLFAAVLLGGLAFGKPLLPYVLDSVVALDAEGWRKLSLRWGVFFIFLALLNEAVWRTQTTDFWVAFKVFGVMPITMGFALLQLPLILRHQIPEEPEPHV